MNDSVMKNEAVINEIEESFRGKIFLTVEDVTKLLSCDVKTVINWTKRLDIKRRPPRIYVGNEVRFPKKPFIQWLLLDQGLIQG